MSDEDQNQKHPGGRPTDYRPEYAEQARKLCELGATNADLAEFFDVSIRTINYWSARHEAFLLALEAGGEAANIRVRRSLYHKAIGYAYIEQQAFKIKEGPDQEGVEVVDVERHHPPDTTALKFWLINKDRDPATRKSRWNDRTQSEVSGPDGGPIETKDVSLADLTDEELALLDRIAEKSSKDD